MDEAQEVLPEPLEKGIVEMVGDSVLLEGVWRGRLAPPGARRGRRGGAREWAGELQERLLRSVRLW